MDDSGLDGTQAPPPPRAFADPSAGLVAAGGPAPRPLPDALTGPVARDAAFPDALSTARGDAVFPDALSVARDAPFPDALPAGGADEPDPAPAAPGPPAAPTRPVRGPAARRAARRVPAQVVPPAQGAPPGSGSRMAPVPLPTAVVQPERRGGKGGLVGWLLVLAVSSGLLVGVAREIIGFVADLFR